MNLVITGFEELIQKLDNADSFISKALADIGELMMEAEQIVNTKYSLQGNGNSDFSTNVKPIENGWQLTVSGDDVGFLEFGAGIFVDDSNEFVQDVPYPVEAGSWSRTHPHSNNPNARYFAKNGFWWWSNIRYTGLYPTRGMQEALNHIRDNVLQVIEKRIAEWIAS